MPCYVITHTHFRDIAHFRTFRDRLTALQDEAHLRILPLRDGNDRYGEEADQSVMLEFDDAETASEFMGSPLFRGLAAAEGDPPPA